MFRTSFRIRSVVLFALIAGVVVFASVKFGPVSEAQDRKGSPEAPQAAVVVATLTDNVTAATKIAPGSTVTYTATITNNGVTPGTDDATNVIFTDQLDANTTLVAGSLVVPPIVADDPNYLAIGNVRIQPTAANGVLANDINPGGGAMTASAGALSTQGGNVTMNADGSFAYNPAPGFAGTDTFTYTATRAGGGAANGTVTIKVGNGTATPGTNVVWFVDPAAAAGGDGRLTNPFNCYTGPAASCFSTTAADDPGDTVFLYSGAHTGGYTLLANQKLIGAGASATLASISSLTVPTGSDPLPPTGGARPTVTTTIAATSAITLGAGNTLRGFNIGNTTAVDITGTAFGTLTASEIDLNGTGRPLNLTTGTLAATFDTLTSTSSPGGAGIGLSGVAGNLTVTGAVSITGASTNGISISGSTLGATFGSTTIATSTTEGIVIGTHTVGTLAFGNTSVTGGTIGVSFQNNASGSRTFGTLTVSGGSGNAFLNVAGGNVTVNNLATLTTAAPSNIDIQNLAAGTLVQFSGGATLAKTAAGNFGVNISNCAGDVTFSGTFTAGTSGSRFPTAAINVLTGTGSFVFGTMSIFTNGFTGVSTTTDGTLNTGNGTVDVNAATVLNVAGPVGLANLGVTLTTINSTGGTNGVNLTNATGTVNLNGGALSGATGATFLVSGGNVNVSELASVTQATAGQPMVSVTGGHTGIINFFNTSVLSATNGTGLQFDNADGNYQFNGTTTLGGGDAGVDILNGSAGNFIFSANTSITNPSGIAYREASSAANVTYSGTIAQNNAVNAVNITKTGGSTVFDRVAGSQITANTTTATAIDISGSTGGTVTFRGGMAITTTSGTGFGSVTGGTINVCDEPTTCAPAATGTLVNTLSSTTGTALNVSSTTIGANNLEFRSISSAGAPNGIVLNTTGSTGGLTVKGNGGICTVATPTCTGGRITGSAGADGAATGIGVSLTSASKVSLTRMRIDNSQNYGIKGTTVSGFTLDTSILDGTNGTAAGAFDEAAIRFDGLTGGANILNSNIANGFEYLVKILNTTGTLSCLTMSNNTYGTNSTTLGGDAVQIVAGNTATINASVTGSTFTNAREDLFNAVATQTANMSLVFQNNNLSNNHTNKVSAASNMLLFSTSTGTVSYDISNNQLTTGATGSSLAVAKGVPDTGSGGTMFGTVNNNTIGLSGVVGSGSQFTGIFASALGSGTHTTAITNNLVRRYNEEGIFLKSNDPLTGGNAVLNATLTGNTTTEPDSLAFAGLWVLAGSGSGTENHTVNVLLGSSSVAGLQNDFTNGDPANSTDVFFQESASVGTAAINLSRAGSVAGTIAAVVADDNVGTPAVVSSGTVNLVAGNPATPSGVTACVPIPIAPPAEEGPGLALLGENLPRAESGVRSAEFANVEMPFWASIMPSADSIKASGSVEMASWNTIKASGSVEMPSADSIKASGDSIKASAESIKAEGFGIKAEGFAEMAPADIGSPSVSAGSSLELTNVGPDVEPSFTASTPLGDAPAGAPVVGLLTRLGEMISPTVYSAEEEPAKAGTPNFSGETITVDGTGTGFTLPAGKSVTITYQATVNAPPNARQLATQGTVTFVGGPGGPLLTDDPEPVGGPQATATLVDATMTWNGATSTDWNTDTNWTPPAGGASYAPGVSNPAVNDVVIPNVGLQPGITASDITVFSLNISNGRTLSITSPRVLTIGGSPGGNLQLDGIISGGFLNLGTGTHTITNAGGTGSLSSTNVATVLSGGTVTLNNNLQAGALAVNAGGSMDITNRTLLLNGPGAALSVPGGATFTTTNSTVAFNGSAAQQAPGIAYGGLTINNSIGAHVTGVTLTGNATVNGVLALTSGDLDTTSGFVLTMPGGGTSTGQADVVGNVRRTGFVAAGAALSFGNPFNTIRINSGAVPTDITVLLAKTVPGTFTSAVQRTYTITPTGANGPATLRLHYRQAELNGNLETPVAGFNLKRATAGPVWTTVTPTARNTGVVEDNWLENNAVAAFSQWTIANAAPTAANVGVSGRVFNAQGRGVAGAIVRMTDQGGNTVYALTNPFGYYHFDDVASGQNYVMTVTSKQYTFAARTVSVSDNITDLDFIAEGKQ